MAEGEDCSEGRQRGRPSIEMDSDDVEFLLSKGFSKSKVAEMLGVSRQTLYNKLSTLDQAHFQKYSDISVNDLDLKVRSIKSTHPNDGEVMLAGHLLSQGIRVQREKLRASIHRVDPTGTAERRSVAVRRRVYHVDAANDVWHIDGNHKLIRWRMVVHGGIDGYSRLITFLQCHTDNRSDSVLAAFMSGVHRYGLPKKVRTDHGGENIEVWRMMMNEHSTHTCVITGSSTHNERIERLWRDVHRSVIVTFSNTFRQLEADEQLDHLNEVDIYCLHSTFALEINRCLQAFAEAWNNHAISTEHNATPQQLFITSPHEEVSESEPTRAPDIDPTDMPSNEVVTVPRCSFRPCVRLQHDIAVALQSRSADDAKSRYLVAIQVCGRHLMTNCNDCNEP